MSYRAARKRRRPRMSLSFLPTMLTLGNGACGMASIAMAYNSELNWSTENKLFAAGCLIFAGMLFDAFDGWAARATKQTSEFGAQLDSLCDAITFGVAPAVLVWQYSNVLPLRVIYPIGVLFTLCTILRLARFNVETPSDDAEDHAYFEGLPSPAAAGTIATFAIATPELSGMQTSVADPHTQELAATVLASCQYLLPALAVILAYLMVSRFRYEHFVPKWLGGHWSPFQIGLALFAIMTVVVVKELALPLMFCYYAFESPIRNWMRLPESARASG
ncbi:CDP-alcohol phosphatidyltransferase [Rosistilla ulvae]|uniref:CDP-diacylglycerol--serine O-phosphatidyltransferase n=2 Tax=Rosistilla ulvae TaxID=1930277 RepID=A0A517M6V7_9BACT|nr:CDP-alcohol phosphatidyltransferase [Rosistilla ulvae]